MTAEPSDRQIADAVKRLALQRGDRRERIVFLGSAGKELGSVYPNDVTRSELHSSRDVYLSSGLVKAIVYLNLMVRRDRNVAGLEIPDDDKPQVYLLMTCGDQNWVPTSKAVQTAVLDQWKEH
jgi:hypothetical protein